MSIQSAKINAIKTQHQIKIEELFNNNQLISRIRKEFEEADDFDFRADFKEHDIPAEFGFSLLVQMVLHKRCDINTLVGCLRRHCSSAQETSDLIVKCYDAGYMQWDQRFNKFVVLIDITREVQEELDRFQFPLPMTVRPNHLHSNSDSAYLTREKDSVILKNNHHEDDVNLDHLNLLNRIAFRINTNVAKFVKNQWRNLAHRKQGESKQDFDKRRKAFEKYDRVSKDILDLLDQRGEIYFTHKYDKRGRTYCQGYHVSYQGNGWNKAVLLFAEEEITNG